MIYSSSCLNVDRIRKIELENSKSIQNKPK
jgi:hypothetical protein